MLAKKSRVSDPRPPPDSRRRGAHETAKATYRPASGTVTCAICVGGRRAAPCSETMLRCCCCCCCCSLCVCPGWWCNVYLSAVSCLFVVRWYLCLPLSPTLFAARSERMTSMVKIGKTVESARNVERERRCQPTANSGSQNPLGAGQGRRLGVPEQRRKEGVWVRWSRLATSANQQPRRRRGRQHDYHRSKLYPLFAGHVYIFRLQVVPKK